MATITHVFTIARVAEMLGVDEDRLHEIAIEMEPEDGVMHVYGIDDDGIMAFTDFGVETCGSYCKPSKRTPSVTKRSSPANQRCGPDRPVTN